jgi:hypothetical protein
VFKFRRSQFNVNDKTKAYRTLQQLFDILGWSSKDSTVASLNDWALHQVGMLNHQRDHFRVAKVSFSEAEFLVDGFALAQQTARVDLHFADQLGEFLLRQWFDVIVDFAEIHTMLAQVLVHLAALCTGWFFVNGDRIAHIQLSVFGLGCLALGLWPGVTKAKT